MNSPVCLTHCVPNGGAQSCDGSVVERPHRRAGRAAGVIGCALIALALIFACGTAEAGPPAPPDFDEGWYVVTIQGQPCGYMHTILKRAGDEVHSQTKTKIEIRRGDALVAIVMQQSARESLSGGPLAFTNIMSLGAEPQTVAGTIDGDTVTLVSEQFGIKQEKTYPFHHDAKFAWGLLLEQRRHGLEPGTTFSLKTYEPSLRKDGPIEMVITVHGKESVVVLGRKRLLTRVTSSLKLDQSPTASPLPGGGMQIDSDAWVDDEANPVVMTVNLGMIQMKMYEATKEEALKRGAPPEMFLSTLVRARKRVGPAAVAVKLRLQLKDGATDRIPTLPDTAMQTFKRVSDREAVVTIRRLDWSKIRQAEDNEPVGPELQAYLEPSSVCDAGDRKIKRLARKAVRGHKTPAEKADALRKFVTGYITNKSMGIGFATASEVARNRTGDCSEHGVLLAALARAAGLPARGVSGIVEVPSAMLGADGSNAFGYHMWTQVHIDGRWVDIDAALRQTDCDPTHVAVSLMPLGEDGLISPVMSLIPLLGQLEIEVLEVRRP